MGWHAGVIGREGNRLAPSRQDVFQRAKKKGGPALAGSIAARDRKKILTVRGERSERPVALPAAPARLNKPEHTTSPAARLLRRPPTRATGLAGTLTTVSFPRPGDGLPAAAAQRPGRLPGETAAAQVGLLAFGVAGAIPAAAVGGLGLPRGGVGVVDGVLDDLPPVGQH